MRYMISTKVACVFQISELIFLLAMIKSDKAKSAREPEKYIKKDTTTAKLNKGVLTAEKLRLFIR